MAIVALVISFVPICLTQIAAIVLACIVLSKSQGKGAGRGQSVAAIVVSGVVLTAMLVAGVVDAFEQSEQDGSREAGSGEVLATSLRVGDCVVDAIRDEKISTVTISPCSEAHVSEVVGVFDVEIGPGDDADGDGDADQVAIDLKADTGCNSRLEKYVGPDHEQLDLVLRYIRPLEGSVELEPSVQCFVDVPSEYLTESLKDAGR